MYKRVSLIAFVVIKYLSLFPCLRVSPRQDPECCRKRTAPDVPEIPAILLALPAEPSK